MRQRFCPVSHELNMIGFVRLSVRLSHRLYKLKPITSTSEMTWHLECERDFEVSQNCKTTTLFFGKRTTKNNAYGRKGPRDAWRCYMHRLHICCTTRVNCSFAIRGNVEFFGCGKAIRSNLRNVPHLIFCKLPLDNFSHSAIRIPQNTRARHCYQYLRIGLSLHCHKFHFQCHVLGGK